MPQRSPLIIHYKTSQIVWLVLILSAIFCSVALAGFFFGNKTYFDNQAYSAELEAGIDELSESLAQKQNALATLQLTAQVDAAALEQARQQMLDMQRQIYQRDQELKLYREMLQDNNKTAGLKVGDLHIERLNDRRFQYDWVAQQKNEKAKNKCWLDPNSNFFSKTKKNFTLISSLFLDNPGHFSCYKILERMCNSVTFMSEMLEKCGDSTIFMC